MVGPPLHLVCIQEAEGRPAERSERFCCGWRWLGSMLQLCGRQFQFLGDGEGD